MIRMIYFNACLGVVLCLLAKCATSFKFLSFQKPSKMKGLQTATQDIETVPYTKAMTSDMMPIPKVPTSAWRWPSVWPFPDDYLTNSTTFSKKPVSDKILEAVSDHVTKFIPKTAKVVEIGSSKYSLKRFLPNSDVRFAPVSEFMDLDLQDYDAVIVSTGVESIMNPIQFFQKVWKGLNPGGSCHICFTSTPSDDIEVSAKMWTTMTEEQRLWIMGSYFQYSVGEGWTGIEGYDVFEAYNTTQLVFQSAIGEDKVYVARADKIQSPTSVDSPSFTQWVNSQLKSTNNLDASDVQYLSLRLAERMKTRHTSNVVKDIQDILPKLSNLYSQLSGYYFPYITCLMICFMRLYECLSRSERCDYSKGGPSHARSADSR
jgi:hypothetical protein